MMRRAIATLFVIVIPLLSLGASYFYDMAAPWFPNITPSANYGGMQGTNAYTFSAWIKYLKPFSSEDYQFDIQGLGGNHSLTVSRHSLGAPLFRAYNFASFAAFYPTVPPTLTTGVWYHIVGGIQYTGYKPSVSNSAMIYVNGESYAISDNGHVLTTQVFVFDTVIYLSLFSEYEMDDMRLYNRKLSDAEVSSIYHLRGKDHIYQGLCLRWSGTRQTGSAYELGPAAQSWQSNTPPPWAGGIIGETQ